MYNPTTRLLTILELLQTYSSLGSEELSRRLEVDPRSVRRYILMLQDLGMPVEATRGPGGGYRLKSGFKLPPLMFTEEEAAALVLGLLGSDWLDIGPSAPAVEGALAKITRVLPERSKERVKAVRDNLALSRDAGGSGPSMARFLDLSEAVHLRKSLRLSYRGLDGELTERTVNPYGVIGWWGRWYLIAWCQLRLGYRSFRVDRIESMEVTDEVFERDESFDPQAFAHSQLDRRDLSWTIRVDFNLPPAEVRRRFPEWFGPFTEIVGGCRYETAQGDLTVVANLLAESRLDFRVVDPPELGRELRAMAERLASGAGEPGKASALL